MNAIAETRPPRRPNKVAQLSSQFLAFCALPIYASPLRCNTQDPWRPICKTRTVVPVSATRSALKLEGRVNFCCKSALLRCIPVQSNRLPCCSISTPSDRGSFFSGTYFPRLSVDISRKRDSQTENVPKLETGVQRWKCGLSQIQEALELLLATVVVVPTFRFFKVSPVLGFLLAGILLGPHGFTLLHDYRDIDAYAEFGVLFLLFEMGLELSIQRLRYLGKFVFGLGTLQVATTTLAIGFLTKLFPGVPNVEALVIGNALSLSSSAFVLQLLRERGELAGRFGQISFAVLLLQDIAVVPLLVVLPLLANGTGDSSVLISALGVAALKGLGALVSIAVVGQLLLSRVFQAVAGSKSPDAFVAAILLTVLGTAYFTDALGLSDTLGAFLAGVLLAETKFRFQIEADIGAARGLLLGLFFMTVGFSMDLALAWQHAPEVAIMIIGLIASKATILTCLGRLFGQDWATSVRTGFLLSQGGEFSFVIFALAKQLGILPADYNSILIVVVAISMALTPALASAGALAAKIIDRNQSCPTQITATTLSDLDSRTIVCGFGHVGQTVARMFNECVEPYVAFDIDPVRVTTAQQAGLPVLYGDASNSEVIKAAGIKNPRSAVITVRNYKLALLMVSGLSREFPGMEIFVRARTKRQQKELKAAGASICVPELLEASLQLGASVLQSRGKTDEEVSGVMELTRREEESGRAPKSNVRIVNPVLSTEPDDNNDEENEDESSEEDVGGVQSERERISAQQRISAQA